MRFIDLFAGLGGFHLALARLGHDCVFASEIDPSLRDLYEQNFGMRPAGDIRNVAETEIPEHDIVCAGFPCQPFSKAGEQNGLADPKWGDLFYHILRIVKHHRPRFVILENVPNLERHNKGRTWEQLAALLRAEGYDIDAKKLSPHRYGVPQIRERVFIVGSLDGLAGFAWPAETHSATSIRAVLDQNPPDARKLPEQVLSCLAMWQDFLDRFPKDEELPSFPIWGMEFGATYPYEAATPLALPRSELRRFRGAHGQTLDGLDEEAIVAALPSYARTKQERFPGWKIGFIRQNRALYDRHREWLDDWRPQLRRFPSSFQKLEWNAKGEPRNLSQFVLQIRASGVRVKRDTTAPSLIAMTTTQVPVITWEQRYMTPRECARLQSMEDLALPRTPTLAYSALGNAVNVRIVELIGEALLQQEHRCRMLPHEDEARPLVTAGAAIPSAISKG